MQPLDPLSLMSIVGVVWVGVYPSDGDRCDRYDPYDRYDRYATTPTISTIDITPRRITTSIVKLHTTPPTPTTVIIGISSIISTFVIIIDTIVTNHLIRCYEYEGCNDCEESDVVAVVIVGVGGVGSNPVVKVVTVRGVVPYAPVTLASDENGSANALLR